MPGGETNTLPDVALPDLRAPDPYTVLGVAPHATEEEIKRAMDQGEGLPLEAFIDKLERKRFSEATMARASALAKRFEKAGWRSAPLDEKDGARSLYAAFGIVGIAG